MIQVSISESRSSFFDSTAQVRFQMRTLVTADLGLKSTKLCFRNKNINSVFIQWRIQSLSKTSTQSIDPPQEDGFIHILKNYRMDCQPTRLFLLWRESFLPSSLFSPPSLLPSLSIPYLALPTAAAQSGRQRLKSVQDMSTFRVRGGLHMTTHTCHSTFEGCLQITAHFIITAALNHALISSFTVFSPTASKSSFGFTLVHL